MAKRFGRQQKRKLKQQIEDQQKQIRHLEAISQETRFYKSAVDDVAYVLGKHFAGLPPKTISVSRSIESLAGRYSMYKSQFSPEAFTKPPTELVVELKAVVRDLSVISSLKPVRTALQDCTHVRLRAGNQQYGYAVTDEMMGMFPRDYLKERIARKVADLMVISYQGEDE